MPRFYLRSEAQHRVEPRGARLQQETVHCLTASASNAKLYGNMLLLELRNELDSLDCFVDTPSADDHNNC